MESILNFIKSPSTWVSLGIIVVTVIACKLLRKSEKKAVQKVTQKQNVTTQIKIVSGFIRYLVVALAILAVLQINGINVTSIITGLGIVGIIVGFALQDLLKDIIMGVSIITRGFLKIDDVIEYESNLWVVTDITLRFLYLRNIDTYETFIVGNRNISEIKIQSIYHDIVIPGSYAIPAEKMRSICEDICTEVTKLTNVDECKFLGTDNFAESQISYKIRIYNKPVYNDEIRREANGIIQDILAKNNIDIPFNQLDVHIDNK